MCDLNVLCLCVCSMYVHTTYVCTYTHTDMYVHTYVCMYVSMYVFMYIYCTMQKELMKYRHEGYTYIPPVLYHVMWFMSFNHCIPYTAKVLCLEWKIVILSL